MNLYRTRNIVGGVTVALLVLVINGSWQPRVEADAASTGKAIGTGINNAITAAFPGISTIINAIWPNGAGNKNKTAATAATQPLQQKSVQGLTQLDTVTSDLDTITLFLANCIVADNQIIAMRTILQGKTSLTPQEKLALENDWNTAKGRLGNLKGASGQVAKMNDPSVQVVLQAVVDSTAGPTDSVTQELAAGNAAIPLLSQNLQMLDQQLSAVNALSSQVIQNISYGLKSAKSTAAGALGSVEESEALKAARADFSKTITERYNIQ
jgi:hypothetical protein